MLSSFVSLLVLLGMITRCVTFGVLPSRLAGHRAHLFSSFAATADTLSPSSGVTTIKNAKPGDSVKVAGWIRTSRPQKTLTFLTLNDGTTQAGLQCVLPPSPPVPLETGSSLVVSGTLQESSAPGQDYELSVPSWSSVSLVGPAPGYPLAKKRHTLEYLRSVPHLRMRTNTLASVARARSSASLAVHGYFGGQGFLSVHTPLLTSSDCEGAGEVFRVDTDLFGTDVGLTVSGQLAAEVAATSVGACYTFGPTFRAENSNTRKHLCEFWMVEPEMPFCDAAGAMDSCEGMVKHVVGKVWEERGEDMRFFTKFYDKGLEEKKDMILEKEFRRVSYTEAVEAVQEEVKKDPSKVREKETGESFATNRP